MAAARHHDVRRVETRPLGQGAVAGGLDREELAFRAARGEGAACPVTGVEQRERHGDDVRLELDQAREGLPAQRVLREIEVEGLPRDRQQFLVVVIDVERQLALAPVIVMALGLRSEEHTSELQSLMRISYAVFCLKKKNQ